MLKPNDFGLFDMQGNVYEWCYDVYAEYPAALEAAIADAPNSDPVRDTDSRRLRGGAFDARDAAVRSASRGVYRSSNRSSTVGFRPARTYHVTP